MDVFFYCSLGHHYWAGYEKGVPERAIIQRDCKRHEAEFLEFLDREMDDPGFVGDYCIGMGI